MWAYREKLAFYSQKGLKKTRQSSFLGHIEKNMSMVPSCQQKCPVASKKAPNTVKNHADATKKRYSVPEYLFLFIFLQKLPVMWLRRLHERK